MRGEIFLLLALFLPFILHQIITYIWVLFEKDDVFENYSIERLKSRLNSNFTDVNSVITNGTGYFYTTRFTDFEFPPKYKSLLPLYLDLASNGSANNINYNRLNWGRASEIIPNYKLFDPGSNLHFSIQGLVSHSLYMSSIASVVYVYPDLIKTAFITNETNDVGIYQLKLYINGQFHDVIIDDYLPYQRDYQEIYLPQIGKYRNDQLWLPLLEKAFAKASGSYFGIARGEILFEQLSLLTGAPIKIYFVKLSTLSTEDIVWQDILKNIENDFIQIAVTNRVGKVEGDWNGLQPNYAYPIIHAKKIQQSNSHNIIILFRDPALIIGEDHEWKGLWSRKYATDASIQELDYSHLPYGYFYIGSADFYNYFNYIEICKYHSNIT